MAGNGVFITKRQAFNFDSYYEVALTSASIMEIVIYPAYAYARKEGP